LKHDDNSIYITQYGPFPEIDSDLSFSNEPADYSQQQLTLDIPASVANPKIAIANMYWSDTGEGFFFYWGICVENYLLDCNDDQWNADLYMMNNVYASTGNTSSICVCSLDDEFFMYNYFTSPFHCIDGSIGSFLNFVPTIVDYLSPDGEQLFFGQSPLFIKSFFTYDNNLFRPYIEIIGYNNEARDYDMRNSTFSLYDSTGDLFAEGELLDLWESYLPPDEYTLMVEDTNFSLKGLAGTGRLTNIFDSSLEMPNPPYINAFQIRNEDDKPVNQLEQNDISSLLVSIADSELIGNEYVYFPVITDSVKAFYKEHFAETWSELDVEFIHDYDDYHTWTFGKVFSADLSSLTAIDSVAYDLKICTQDEEENYTEFILEPAFTVGNFDATSISDNEIPNKDPNELFLSNFPNPFNSTTTISFSIKENIKNAEISIYNLKGQEVKQLTIDDCRSSIEWNATDEFGKIVSNGVYFYKLNVNNETKAVRKMILLR
ncbi:MAG TPA: T9SS type A sorting domain-containing protein, partial [Candidatus Cloacimonetes bacterium]|nr:T9SS type A sorting domain-containing protein [Candidatus Cloacimonadota bacterium]